MFNAVRTSAAALLSALAFCSWAGAFVFPPAADAALKSRDFGTPGIHSAGMVGGASPARTFSTSSTILNVSVCAALYDQGAPFVVADGGGGLIAVWSDYRNGNLDIYAQKLNG